MNVIAMYLTRFVLMGLYGTAKSSLFALSSASDFRFEVRSILVSEMQTTFTWKKKMNLQIIEDALLKAWGK